MFCNNCRAQIPDGSAVCPYCGSQQAQQQPQYQQPQYQQPYQQPQYQQPQYQQPYQQPQYQQPYPQSSPLSSQPMNWHKFLVYFSLWASAVGFLVYAIMYFTGAIYGSYTEGKETIENEYLKKFLYASVSGIQAMDIIYGILLLGLSGFGFFVAYSMLKFKKGAPKLLTISYIAMAGASLLYAVIAFIMLSSNSKSVEALFEAEWPLRGVIYAFSMAIGAIVMLFINRAYYKKREHLFVY